MQLDINELFIDHVRYETKTLQNEISVNFKLNGI